MFEGQAGTEKRDPGLPAGSADWAVPGVPRPAPPPAVPQLSEPLRLLIEAVAALRAQDVSRLSGAQALAETASLFAELQALELVGLRRLADVDRRGLYQLDDAPSTAAWVATHDLGVDRAQVTLARRLDVLPLVSEELLAGRVSLPTAQRLQAALARLRPHVDRPDGRIDGQPAEQALQGVIVDAVRTLVAEARGGFAGETDPVLVALTEQLQAVWVAERAELARLEAAFLVLAKHVEPGQLPACLGLLVDALLPDRLEERARAGHDRRGVQLTRHSDGSGWRLSGELDLECGERLHTLLRAELARDPDAPVDSETARRLREQGLDPYDPALPACTAPRGRAQRSHDALSTGLARYLDADLGGRCDKTAVQVVVTVPAAALAGRPGAVPARAGSGAVLPAGLVRQWACDSAVLGLVVDLAGRVIETSHTERTLKAHERRAKHTQTGGQCEAAGCTRSTREPGTRMHFHHATPWARCGTTSLSDTVLLCDVTHRDLHEGQKRVRLKNGRVLGPDGWTTDR